MSEYNSLIFELSEPGRVSYSLPKLDVEREELTSFLPEHLIRKEEANLPEIS